MDNGYGHTTLRNYDSLVKESRPIQQIAFTDNLDSKCKLRPQPSQTDLSTGHLNLGLLIPKFSTSLLFIGFNSDFT